MVVVSTHRAKAKYFVEAWIFEASIATTLKKLLIMNTLHKQTDDKVTVVLHVFCRD